MSHPRRAVATALLIPILAVLPACTDAGGDQPAATPTPQSTSPTTTLEPFRLEAAVTRVAGRLPDRRRERVARQAGQVVERYVQAAFLSAPPANAFAGFTRGARREARQDRRLLTAAGFGGRAQVTARHAAAYLSVLAPRGRVVGATARLEVDLRVDRAGQARTVRLRGRLMLTPTPQGWRVFGYDVSRSGGAGKGEK